MSQDHDPRGTPDDRLSQERPETSTDSEGVESSGISNRAIEEEQREQQNLPPRDEDKEEAES
jgi:hypothetical protein